MSAAAAIDLTDASLKKAWDEMTAKEGKTNWILFAFESDKSTKLVAAGEGAGGIDELKTHLKEEGVFYGAFRVVGVDNRETTVSRRPKYIWFTFIGSRVAVLKKAKTSTQKPEVAKFFASAQMNIELSSVDDLTKNEVAKKLLGSGGAHKPTHYEFAENDNLAIGDIK